MWGADGKQQWGSPTAASGRGKGRRVEEENEPLVVPMDEGPGVEGLEGISPSRAIAAEGVVGGATGGLEEDALSGNWATFFNSMISFVGAGVLGMPTAFKTAGLGLGSVAMVVVAAVCLHCMLLVVRCRRALTQRGVRATSYGDVGRNAAGACGAGLVDLCVGVSQTCFCIAYLIFIAKNVPHALGGWPPRVVMVLLCTPGLLAMCLVRHLKYVAPFSLVADAANFFSLGMVFLYDVRQIVWGPPVKREWFRLEGLPFFVGVATYCYEAIGMVIPIEMSMKQPHRFTPLWSFVTIAVSVLYWVFGFTGYYAFGEETADVITLNLSSVDSSPTRIELPDEEILAETPLPPTPEPLSHPSARAFGAEVTVIPHDRPPLGGNGTKNTTRGRGSPTEADESSASGKRSGSGKPSKHLSLADVRLRGCGVVARCVGQLVLVSMSVGLYFTYPIMMFPVLQLLELRLWPPTGEPPSQERGMMLRGGMVLLTAAVACMVPNFSVFISVVGSVVCSLLAFVLPSFFNLRIRGGSWFMRAVDMTTIGFGLFVMLMGLRDGLSRFL